ncbi:MAG: RNA methyltransferase [Candidatus Puniceispirillales bacterium]
MRGYAALGVEGVSKARNAGAVIRTAHAFGASFAFLVGGAISKREIAQTDTSKSIEQMPLYLSEHIRDFSLPEGCSLVGIEITDDAHDLPSFRHPRAAAYVLGGERTGLSPEMVSLCDHIVKIPTRFSLNLAVAGALVLYDRLQSMQAWPERPLMPGGAPAPMPEAGFGEPLWLKKKKRRHLADTDDRD